MLFRSPHAVDDRRDRREQLDGRAERPLEPGRRELGEEKGDAEAHRHADQHGDERGHDRAEDRDQRAELLGDRVPFRRPEEARAVLRERDLAADHQRHQNSRQQAEDHQREEPGQPLERPVLPGVGLRGRRRLRQYQLPWRKFFLRWKFQRRREYWV